MSSVARLLWVDLCRVPSQYNLCTDAQRHCDVKRVTAAESIGPAVVEYRPQLVCIEFDYPTHRHLQVVPMITRRYPKLSVLMVTDFHSEALAIWAFRSGVLDYRVKPIDESTFARLLDAMARARPESGSDLYVRRLPSDLIAPAGHLRRPYPATPRTSAAVAYISEHFADPISLQDVAQLCHLSTSEFCRLFHREQGMPFRRFLLKFRINRACEFMVEPISSVSEVAYAVGFNDLSYFGRAFRQMVGVSAKQYQRFSIALGDAQPQGSEAGTSSARLSD